MVFAEALDIEMDCTDWTLDIGKPSAEDISHAISLLQGRGIDAHAPYILLSPFTGQRQKNWCVEDAKRFAYAAARKYDMPVVVLGTEEYAGEARDISPYNLVGKTSVRELAALIQRAVILVTPDSGPMHVAGAVGTPVAALFGKELPSRWAPKQQCRVIYLDLPCSPCDDDTARRCGDLGCMRGISAEMVLEECDALIGGLAHSN